jgi:hypothetical protein
MPGHVRQGFVGLSTRHRTTTGDRPYTMLALNLLSQLVCVSGVNQLSSVSTVTTKSINISPTGPTPPSTFASPTRRRPSPPNKPVPVSDCNTQLFLLTTPFFPSSSESICRVNAGRSHGAQGD